METEVNLNYLINCVIFCYCRVLGQNEQLTLTAPNPSHHGINLKILPIALVLRLSILDLKHLATIGCPQLSRRSAMERMMNLVCMATTAVLLTGPSTIFLSTHSISFSY